VGREKRVIIGGFSDEAIGALVAAFRGEGLWKRKTRRRRYDVEIAARCHEIWEAFRSRMVVRMGTNRKVSHSDVYEYARDKLAKVGVVTLVDFKGALTSYNNRMRRQ